MRAAALALVLVVETAGATTFLSEVQTDLRWVLAPVVSPDGEFAYSDDTVYDRDPGTGTLTPLALGPDVSSPDDVVLASADAAFLYVSELHGVSVHARDALTGLLTFVELEPGSPNFPFREPVFLAASRDGTNLYGTTSSGIISYERNPTTGELTFLDEILEGDDPGEIPDVGGGMGSVVSPDDLHVYVGGDALVAYERTGPNGALTHLATYPSFAGFESIAMSPDGLHVYATTSGTGIEHYARDPLTGALTFASLEPATVREGLERFTSRLRNLGMPADGTRLIGVVQSSLVVFDRDPVTGALEFLTFERLSGRAARFSPDGLNVYAGQQLSGVFVFGSFACTPAPAAGCQPPVASRKSVISIKNSTPASDKLTWRTTPAGTTAIGDFGDPVSGNDDVVFCVYDASANAQPLAEILGPARGTCSREPCWETASSGTRLKYVDRSGLPGGLQKLTARQRDPGEGTIKLKAKSFGLALPVLPLTPPVRVQLQSRTGACWEAVYSSPKDNDAARFNAKSD